MLLQAKNGNLGGVQGQCPHGVAPSGCPSCSGGGGGGGKSKSSGLMSWNEAFAVWNALQVAENRNKDFLKSSAAVALLREKENNRSTTGPLINLANVMMKMTQNLTTVLKAWGVNPPLVATLQKGLTLLTSIIYNQSETLSGQLLQLSKLASQRLAALLNEAIRIVENAFQSNVEAFKALVAKLNWQEAVKGTYTNIRRLFESLKTSSVLKKIKQILSMFIGSLLTPDSEAASSTQDNGH